MYVCVCVRVDRVMKNSHPAAPWGPVTHIHLARSPLSLPPRTTLSSLLLSLLWSLHGRYIFVVVRLANSARTATGMSGGVGPSCKECLPVRDVIKRSVGHFIVVQSVNTLWCSLFLSLSLDRSTRSRYWPPQNCVALFKIEIQQFCSYNIRNHFLLTQLIYI